MLLALTGVAHTVGQFTHEEPELAKALAAMRDAHLPMGLGMAPSLFDIFRDLAFTMSITFFALAAFNVVIARHRDTTPALLRAATVLNLVWLAAFIALCCVIGAFLFWKGWLKITYTGVIKPLVQLSILGINISIEKPAPPAQ